MLTYKTYNGLTIYPLGRGSSKRRLLCRVDPANPDAITHYRLTLDAETSRLVNLFKRIEAADQSLLEDAQPAAAEEVEATAVYGGVLFLHFGHFLAESIHRLWLLDEIGHQGPIYFHVPTKDGVHYKTELPHYAKETFGLLGIESSQIRTITHPMRFRMIHVPDQGRILGGKSDANYGNAIRHISSPAATRRGALYISRSQYLHSGGFFGELCLEGILKAKGVEVIRPETLDIGELALRLQSYATLVFSEGSAVHALELVKNLPVRVIILLRRPPERTKYFFEALFSRIGSSPVYIPYSRRLCPIEWDQQTGRPSRPRTPVYFKAEHLLGRLGAELDIEFSPNDIEQFNRSIPMDILRFLSHEESVRPNTTSDQQYGMMLRDFFGLMREILQDLTNEPSDPAQGS